MINETKEYVVDSSDRHNGSTYISTGSMDGEFQGEVKLRVESTASIVTIISFVNALRQKNHIRLLEILGTAEDGVDMRIALRMPVPLLATLGQIEGVSKVELPQGEEETGDEPLVFVRLAG